MRLYRIIATCGVAALGFGGHYLPAQTLTGEAWKLEAKGDAAEARNQLQKATEGAPNNPLALEAYAEFLGHHRDPGARGAYEKLLQLYSNNGASPAERAKVARRLVELDLMAGDRAAAQTHLEAFRSAGGTGLVLPAAVTPPPSACRPFRRISHRTT
jgi:tetratricopeptide (TPR) repeat protein